MAFVFGKAGVSRQFPGIARASSEVDLVRPHVSEAELDK
jgi:hypothetical protein